MNPYAVKYGLGRAWGCTALTLGMWLVLWFHRTRKLLDGELGGRRDDAVLHSIGLLVPVWNILVLYWLYRDLDELRRWHGLREIPVGAYVAGGALAPAILYSLALVKVNEFWDVRTHGLATEAPFSSPEKGLLAAGAAVWVIGSAWMVLWVFVLAGSGPLADMV